MVSKWHICYQMVLHPCTVLHGVLSQDNWQYDGILDFNEGEWVTRVDISLDQLEKCSWKMWPLSMVWFMASLVAVATNLMHSVSTFSQGLTTVSYRPLHHFNSFNGAAVYRAIYKIIIFVVRFNIQPFRARGFAIDPCHLPHEHVCVTWNTLYLYTPDAAINLKVSPRDWPAAPQDDVSIIIKNNCAWMPFTGIEPNWDDIEALGTRVWMPFTSIISSL